MELIEKIKVPAILKYGEFRTVAEEGQGLKIRVKGLGVELNEDVPEGKKWELYVQVSINELEA